MAEKPMKPYRLKSVAVRALQVTAEMFRAHQAEGAPLPAGVENFDPVFGCASVHDCLRGMFSIRADDWLVEDPLGCLYVVTDERFRRDYEAVYDAADTSDIHQAAQKILRCFYLYGNYSINSRGPSGLLIDVLEVLDPVAAAKFRDGEDAGDLLDPSDY